MTADWFLVSPGTCLHVVLSTLCAYLGLIALAKLNGLRTFAKMSSFDFGVTVAIGSLLAATIVSKDPPLFQGLLAMATLLVLQSLTAQFRFRNETFEDAVDNCPLLLMDGPDILQENLRQGKVTVADLKGKLREANVLQYSQVKAVVLEATGDISVLHSSDPSLEVEQELLEGIKGADTA